MHGLLLSRLLLVGPLALAVIPLLAVAVPLRAQGPDVGRVQGRIIGTDTERGLGDSAAGLSRRLRELDP